MANSEILKNARKNPNDEFYTLREEVEYLLSTLPLDYLKDKIVYSPCDSELSEFVKYIKSHKDELLYKEYIYTSDDLFTHIELFELCDIVITNPPFSRLRELIIMLNEQLNKVPDYLLVGGVVGHYLYVNHFTFNAYNYYYKTPGYIRPNGSVKFRNSKAAIITNIKDIRNIKYYPRKFRKSVENPVFLDLKFFGENVLECSRLNDMPTDYSGFMAIPMTSVFLNVNVMDKVDFYAYGGGFGTFYGCNLHNIKRASINSKETFIRFIVKWKKFSTEEDLKLLPKKLKSEPLF